MHLPDGGKATAWERADERKGNNIFSIHSTWEAGQDEIEREKKKKWRQEAEGGLAKQRRTSQITPGQGALIPELGC